MLRLMLKNRDLFRLAREVRCQPVKMNGCRVEKILGDMVSVWMIRENLLFCPRRTASNHCGDGLDASFCQQPITRATLTG